MAIPEDMEADLHCRCRGMLDYRWQRQALPGLFRAADVREPGAQESARGGGDCRAGAGTGVCGSGIACPDYIEHMIQNESDVAAIIMEPVVGTNGVLVPPPEYFPKIREICDRHGVLLIADEVMAGWGRTGKWFAVDHWGVKPDILVTAKGITSAYVPLGLCATTKKIADHFEDHYFSHGHTYEAH